MVTAMNRNKVKGDRTPRSMDVYHEKEGLKGVAYCGCGAVFHSKRWHQNGDVAMKPHEGRKLVCPACRRIADRMPAGIVSLRGSFFSSHEAEINNLLHNTEQASLQKNPLGRVMETHKEGDGVVITTTDGKLAQKIGREVFKSYGGKLNFLWSQSENLVRVAWSR